MPTFTITVRDPFAVVCALRNQMQKLEELERNARAAMTSARPEPGAKEAERVDAERRRWNLMHHACRDGLVQLAQQDLQGAADALADLGATRDVKRAVSHGRNRGGSAFTLEARASVGLVQALRDEVKRLDELYLSSRPGGIVGDKDRTRLAEMREACTQALREMTAQGDAEARCALEEAQLRRPDQHPVNP